MGTTKKILVTGGAGYIGSHTVVELQKAGYQPVIVDDLSNSEAFIVDRIRALAGADIRFYKVDCRNREALSSVFQMESPIDSVIHFAAFKAVGESVEHPLRYYDNNLVSLLTLLNVMDEQGVENLVFSSSCTVYGVPEVLPVTELSPVQTPQSPYGRTKQICEAILEDMVPSGGSTRTVLLRYFNPIGAHPSAMIGELPKGVPNNLVPFITQAAIGLREKLIVFGDDYDTKDGTCVRDYIHVIDLAKAHIAAMQWLGDGREAPVCEVFNVGTGQGSSVLEVIKAFEETTGKDLCYEMGARRAGDVPEIFASADHSNKVLKWKAELGLSDALQDAWNWQIALGQEQE